MESELKIHKTTVPGDMTMEEWQNGGFSKYNHPKAECKGEVVIAVDKFKDELNTICNNAIRNGYNVIETSHLLNFINTYKP